MTCKEFDNPREEYMCVVAALKKRMERGEDLLNTAILLRTKSGIGRSDQCADGISGSFYNERTASQSFPPLDLPCASGLS